MKLRPRHDSLLRHKTQEGEDNAPKTLWEAAALKINGAELGPRSAVYGKGTNEKP